ncbi:MAG: sodium-dependent transporter, partial [Muribaculaceae bacterium]|nr:sodium-dependent transporter [Muribaculaceae bacterium]
MAEKAKFGSKIGLVAATVGSAIGLGNVWRFPAEAQTNGGAAFLIVYVLCVLILGIPVMLAELSLGRAAGTDAVGAFRRFAPRTPWWIAGALPVLASYLILSFYMVVAGWTLEYFLQSISGALYAGTGAGSSNAVLDGVFKARMQEYICGSTGPLFNTFALILLNLGVLVFGVRKGIERLSNVLMPLLFVLLVVFCCVTLSLPKAGEGLRFFFEPDFSRITPKVVVSALGQAFFSLSLGMGILITYAAYYPKETRLMRTSVTVSLLDMMAAILMGVVIFPAVTSFGLDGADLEGTALVFVTLPEVFARMPGTQLWSSLFFLLLLVAALTSTVSIAEVSVSFVQDRFRRSRRA